MGDVAGHGVAATAQAGQLRHSLRVYAHEGYAAGETLRRLNELLLGDEQARMATMCIVAVDDDPAAVCMSCAGHPPPLLLPAGGEPRLAECDTNVVLGVIGGDYVEESVPFTSGDRLVLYTDGLMERPGETIDAGAGAARGRRARASTGSRRCGRTSSTRWSDPEQPRDDVALLLAQRR